VLARGLVEDPAAVAGEEGDEEEGFGVVPDDAVAVERAVAVFVDGVSDGELD
jgi:hypothetical protein